jgi:phosphoserine phosphatase RsbU/P
MPFQPVPAKLVFGDLEMASVSVPAHGEPASGDGLFVEVGRTDDNLMLLMVGVTGHGDPAAQTVTLIAHHLLHDPTYLNRGAGELLTRLNGLLQAEFSTTGRFVAALSFLVGGQNGRVTGANASQPEPLLGQPSVGWQTWHLPNGPPLGILISPAGYQEATTTLTGGEQLLAFTDGVTEAGTRQGHQFQNGPLLWSLGGFPPGLPAHEVVAELLGALQGHVQANWPEDDVTILCLQRR